MTDTPRKPLTPLNAELRRKILAAGGLDANGWPLNATPEERAAHRLIDATPDVPLNKADRRAALTAAQEKPNMEPTKPGVKTSEFWLQILVGLAIAVITFTLDNGLPAIAAQLAGLGALGAVLTILVPVVKLGLTWLLQRLSSNYAEARADVKIAASAAGTAPKG